MVKARASSTSRPAVGRAVDDRLLDVGLDDPGQVAGGPLGGELFGVGGIGVVAGACDPNAAQLVRKHLDARDPSRGRRAPRRSLGPGPTCSPRHRRSSRVGRERAPAGHWTALQSSSVSVHGVSKDGGRKWPPVKGTLLGRREHRARRAVRALPFDWQSIEVFIRTCAPWGSPRF